MLSGTGGMLGGVLFAHPLYSDLLRWLLFSLSRSPLLGFLWILCVCVCTFLFFSTFVFAHELDSDPLHQLAIYPFLLSARGFFGRLFFFCNSCCICRMPLSSFLGFRFL